MRFRVFSGSDRAQFFEKVRRFVQRPRVRRWLKLTDVARRLDVDARKLRRLSEKGEFPVIITKGKVSWVDEQQVLDWQREEMRRAEDAPNRKAMRAAYVRSGKQHNDIPDFLRQ